MMEIIALEAGRMLDTVKRLKRQWKLFILAIIFELSASVLYLITFLYDFFIKREVEIISLIISILLATMIISFIFVFKLMKKQNLDDQKNDNSKIQ